MTTKNRRSKAAEMALTWKDLAPAGSEEKKLFDEAGQLYYDGLMAKPTFGSGSPKQMAIYNRARRLVLKAHALRNARIGA